MTNALGEGVTIVKRKIYQEMLEWKQNWSSRRALLINGARRVGKSYIAEEFAKNEYKSNILIDFNNVSDDVKDIFKNYLHDLDNFFLQLSVAYGTKLFERETLFIFDEIQMFPRARGAIKYLVADGRYDYIETGSLVSIKKNVEDIVVPSEERHLNMYPMDFEEFLWALDEIELMAYIAESYEKMKQVGTLIHRKAIYLFRQYMIIGGMPQAVLEYLNCKDFDSVDIVKRDIINLYRDDISKHSADNYVKVRSIFDEIPSQLSKHDKKFRLSAINKNARIRDYEDSLFWLSDAMIINNCYNSSEPNIGLKLNMDRMTLKCYMADTGLLVSHAFDEKAIVSEQIHRKLLLDRIEINEGMFMENIVAQMLVSSGHRLYFYASSNRNDSSENMEIDFLIAKSKLERRHNISVLEVKSSKRYRLSSLEKYRSKFDKFLHKAIVLHTKDVMVKDDIIYLPIYMAALL
jgi:predicted AAA+ superfamily ATPase